MYSDDNQTVRGFFRELSDGWHDILYKERAIMLPQVREELNVDDKVLALKQEICNMINSSPARETALLEDLTVDDISIENNFLLDSYYYKSQREEITMITISPKDKWKKIMNGVDVLYPSIRIRDFDKIEVVPVDQNSYNDFVKDIDIQDKKLLDDNLIKLVDDDVVSSLKDVIDSSCSTIENIWNDMDKEIVDKMNKKLYPFFHQYLSKLKIPIVDHMVLVPELHKKSLYTSYSYDFYKAIDFDIYDKKGYWFTYNPSNFSSYCPERPDTSGIVRVEVEDIVLSDYNKKYNSWSKKKSFLDREISSRNYKKFITLPLIEEKKCTWAAKEEEKRQKSEREKIQADKNIEKWRCVFDYFKKKETSFLREEDIDNCRKEIVELIQMIPLENDKPTYLIDKDVATDEIFFKQSEDGESYEIYEGFRDHLKYFDLSSRNIYEYKEKPVKLNNTNFSGSNVRYVLTWIIQDKDLSNCTIDVSMLGGQKLKGVNLSGAHIVDEKNSFINAEDFKGVIVNEDTVFCDSLIEKINSDEEVRDSIKTLYYDDPFKLSNAYKSGMISFDDVVAISLNNLRVKGLPDDLAMKKVISTLVQGGKSGSEAVSIAMKAMNGSSIKK